MNRAYYFNAIEARLNFLALRITSRGKLNILDFHGHAENFFKHLLNEVNGWNLVNVNESKQNAEAIDLIDHVNKFVIQVSSVASKQKIESSLSKDSMKNYAGYAFKFISIAKDADDLRKVSFENPHEISFNPSTDIIDTNSILAKIRGLHINAQERIYQFLKSELEIEIDPMKLETNLAAVINILSKEDWDKKETLAEINSFEIDGKISYNNLNEGAKAIIGDYAVHYGRVDKIYATFDLQGHNKSSSVLSAIRQEYAKAKGNLTADQLFFKVISEIQEKVLNSSNYTPIPLDELELCANILAVDAFIRCKIFENPNNYNHASA